MPEESAQSRDRRMPLDDEYNYYSSMKADLVRHNEGKFALIKGGELIGTFDTDQDAYKVGLERFGNVPFLIVRVDPDPEISWIPALSLGLLNAGL